jgi:GGDEF domain-containing protein
VPGPPTGPRVVVTVTVSIGAAERGGCSTRPRSVIRAARAALRHAVEAGRNQVIAPRAPLGAEAESPSE